MKFMTPTKDCKVSKNKSLPLFFKSGIYGLYFAGSIGSAMTPSTEIGNLKAPCFLTYSRPLMISRNFDRGMEKAIS